MSTFTLEQKKLEQIRKQLYGKQQPVAVAKSLNKDTKITENNLTTKSAAKSNTYLPDNHIKQDLVKVAFLSVLAIIFQFFLYTAIMHNWLGVNSYGLKF